MQITTQQVARWKTVWDDACKDHEWVDQQKKFDQYREKARVEMVDLLQRYLRGEIATKDFKDKFQKNTSSGNKWDGFGLNGFNGAMALNMLVKHLPDDSLSPQLKKSLPVPPDISVAKVQLKGIADFVDDLKRRGALPTQARVPFLISAWWHVQSPKDWPIFHPCDQKFLKQEGAYNPTNNGVDDYFSFREAFLAISTALNISNWDLEHLHWRCSQNNLADTPQKKMPQEVRVAPETCERDSDDNDHHDEASDVSVHQTCQLLLANIGRRLGCNIWIASNDHGKKVDGMRLGDLSLPELPNLGLDALSQNIVRLIDVLWLKGNNQVVAAFEIEHTTSIYSGLLRMSDLVAQLPNLTFPLYIVAPESRIDKVRKQLSRPTFKALQLNEACGFFAIEALTHDAANIMQWANDPTAIKKLASYVR